MAATTYSLGLDFGTSSVRALIARVADGREVGLAVAPFPHGVGGVIGDERNPNVARQNPVDYKTSVEVAVQQAILAAGDDPDFGCDRVIGIGVDATASTPIPVDANVRPLVDYPEFSRNLNAHAWLWKDHCAYAEAEEITEVARKHRPEFLAKCGGTYSSEWLLAKLLHCLRVAPELMRSAEDWVEQGDYIVGFLTGCTSTQQLKRNVCAAGHKALYSDAWGGPPDTEFLTSVDPRLGDWCKDRLAAKTYTARERAGTLCAEWADRFGLLAGTPVSVAAIDAHVGAVGAGIRAGTLVKILGTSGCDMAVHPANQPLADIPGLCGIVKDSILPGHFGLEAGQAALGDLFGWFVRNFTKPAGVSHTELTDQAARLKAGESGLLGLDWNNGNRTVLTDPLLTGCLIGHTLQTRPFEVYRALLESSAFGARVIMQRFEDYDVRVDNVVVCGGIAEKNELLLQIFADVTRRPISISRSQETCALGAAIFGSVAAGKNNNGHASVAAAQDAMTGLKDVRYEPNPQASEVYDEVYRLYLLIHDAFGTPSSEGNLFGVMKKLIAIREKVRSD